MLRNNNVRLFPIYKMFSWDLLFFYAISFLFLTSTKGFSASEVLFAEAFYYFFKMFFEVISINIIDKFGKKNTMVLGNLLVAASVYILICVTNISHIILSYAFMAFGYAIKDCAEAPLLDSSLPNSTKKGYLFSLIDSRGSTLWYILDAVSCIATGFLFVYNNYLPLYICLGLNVFSALISLKFNHTADIKEQKQKLTVKEYLKDFKYSFRFIFRSKRLKSLLLFSMFFQAILQSMSPLRSSMYVDLQLPAEYFGIVAAALQILSGIATKKQSSFHNKYRNKVLSYFGIAFALSVFFAGIAGVINLSFSLYLVIALFAVQYIIKGPSSTIIKRYFNNFSNPKISTKIYAAKAFSQAILEFSFTMFASFLLAFTTTSNTLIILGIIFLVVFWLISKYMKPRVGLKPEQYKKSDIEYVGVR